MKYIIKKAVIPAAGLGTRFLPATKAQPKEMLPIVDKPAIQFIVEEAVRSGIKDILIITNSNKRSIEDHFDHNFELEHILNKNKKSDLLQMIKNISCMVNVHYIRQKEPKGLGDAILCAKTFVNNEPFAVLLGDDIIYTEEHCQPALKQLMDLYAQCKKTVLGVQEIKGSEVNLYGIIDPIIQKTKANEKVFKLKDIIEKPKLNNSPSNLAVMGRYILTPNIFDILVNQNVGTGGEIQLTDAIKTLLSYDSVYSIKFSGKRYDIGDKLGFIKATIDYSLKNRSLRKNVLEYIKTIINNEEQK